MQKKSLWLCKWALIPIIFFSFKTHPGHSVTKQDKMQEVSSLNSSVKIDSVSIIYNELNLAGKGLAFTTFEIVAVGPGILPTVAVAVVEQAPQETVTV